MSAAERFLANVHDLPPVPRVALRVLNCLEDDTRNVAELARIVSADTALSARLIRVSNSAYYGFPRRLSTVREAVMVLGFRQLRQIVLGASLIEAWRDAPACPGFDLRTFWNHSLVVALGCETAARVQGVERPEEAFTAGILHDVGVLAMLAGDPVRLSWALARAAAGSPLGDAERAAFGFDHAELGAELADASNFPPALAMAAGEHHNEGARGLAELVARADRLALANGLASGFRTEPTVGLTDAVSVDALRAGASFGQLIDRSRAFVDSICGPESAGCAAAA